MSRFRLFPDASQEAALLTHCAHARFVWNLGLEQRLMWRPGRSAAPGLMRQCQELTDARSAEPWLALGSQTVQQQALRDLDQAWRNFFVGTHRRPSWRKAGVAEGFRIVGSQARRVEPMNHKWSKVLVPKVGWVRLRRTRTVPDAASYRVTRDRSGRWHIAFAAIPEPIPAPGNGSIVGIDRGVVVSAALSTGELLHAPQLGAKEVERLVRLQRQLARCQRGSNRRARVKAQIARLKAREVDRRKDWVEKTTTRLANEFDRIRVEDLQLRNMTRSARGTLETPGRRVAQKAGLNRAILANAWGHLVTRLEHKASGRVERVSAAYTSQTCSACLTTDSKSRKSQAVFVCRTCGHTTHADTNAAINIANGTLIGPSRIAAGRAVTARGATATPVAAKREPQLAG